MYQDFFGFREKPFSITPDPAFLYLSPIHKEAFAHLLFAIKDRSGFAVMIGEVGTGKTTILRSLFNQLDSESHFLAYLFNPSVSGDEILALICREFGLPWEGATRAAMFETLNRFLLQENSAGRTVVLVIDEAQNLERDALEQIRLISNLETEKNKLIQVILVGQPELERLLASPQLRQLNQRVSVRFVLQSLGQEETSQYVRHRLKVAGYGGLCPFTAGALRKIYRFSRGCPRRINIICDRALLIGYTCNSQQITGRITAQAARETGDSSWNRAILYPLAPLALLAAILFFFAGIFFGTRHQDSLPVEPAAVIKDAEQGVTPVLEVEKPPADSDRTGFHQRLGAIRDILAGASVEETAVASFNAVAEEWKIMSMASMPSRDIAASLTNAAYARGLGTIIIQGRPETLLSLNTPAILEVPIGNAGDKRFLAVIRWEDNRFYIAPSFPGRVAIDKDELGALWGGKAFIFWKNYLSLPNVEDPGLRAQEISTLKNLLLRVDLHIEDVSPVYDRQTVDTIRRFQRSRHISPDGKVGPQTLLLLYQESPDFKPPSLNAERNNRGQS